MARLDRSEELEERRVSVRRQREGDSYAGPERRRYERREFGDEPDPETVIPSKD